MCFAYFFRNRKTDADALALYFARIQHQKLGRKGLALTVNAPKIRIVPKTILFFKHVHSSVFNHLHPSAPLIKTAPESSRTDVRSRSWSRSAPYHTYLRQKFEAIYFPYALKTFLPFALLLFKTLRPVGLLILFLKPCTLLCFLFFG